MSWEREKSIYIQKATSYVFHPGNITVEMEVKKTVDKTSHQTY